MTVLSIYDLPAREPPLGVELSIVDDGTTNTTKYSLATGPPVSYCIISIVWCTVGIVLYC